MTPTVRKSFKRLDRAITTAIVHNRRTAKRSEDVLEHIAIRTGWNLRDLQADSRGRSVTYARHLAMWALKEHARLSIAEISSLLKRDHSTVLAGIRKIELEATWRAETAADMAALSTAGR